MNQAMLEKEYPYKVTLSSPKAVYDEMQDIKSWSKEVVVVFALDTANRIISREVVGIGTLNSSIIHPREIFRTAILRNANSIILSHNHPSGSLDPSREDRVVTERLRKAGELLGIELLDHVIVAESGFYSHTDARNK